MELKQVFSLGKSIIIQLIDMNATCTKQKLCVIEASCVIESLWLQHLRIARATFEMCSVIRPHSAISND